SASDGAARCAARGLDHRFTLRLHPRRAIQVETAEQPAAAEDGTAHAAATMIPYTFAKTNGVVVTALNGEFAEVAVRGDALSGALTELRRTLGVPLRARRIATEEFDVLIAAKYHDAAVVASARAD